MDGSAPRRGEIWYVETPNQPHDPDQPRPALIVSENRRNFNKDDYVVVPIFSAGNLGPTRVVLPQGEGGIAHDSVLFCDELTCLNRDFMSFEDGALGKTVRTEILEAVVIAIRRAIGEVVLVTDEEQQDRLRPYLSFLR